jgi:hypothetical protein
MTRMNVIASTLLALFFSATAAMAQRPASLADNAALRYWAAFSQLQDAAISDQDAKELNAALNNLGPYDASKYKDLIQKNSLALQVMARGTTLPNCDWGLDYGLGSDTPVDYARQALVLGRLNILYAMQLFHGGDKDGAMRTLVAGLRFSHDVANGGSLFPTLVAKELLMTHLAAVGDGVRMIPLSASERSLLLNAVVSLGDGLDWSMAAKRDLEALRSERAAGSHSSESLTRIESSYGVFLKNDSNLPDLMDAINQAPPELARLIPNPKKVAEQKHELADKLEQTRRLLQ